LINIYVSFEKRITFRGQLSKNYQNVDEILIRRIKISVEVHFKLVMKNSNKS